ncbi:MAG: RNA polymerase sigma factor [Planctomycetota bacterium]|jgi:RNA polymerase sigma-70 factor (ECF subfamily)
MGEDEIERLIELAREGDQEAAGELAKRYEGRVRASIRRRLGPELRARVETDDIFQTSFFAALGDLAGFRYRGEAAFVRWLSTVAERKMLMTARRHRAGKRDLRLEWPLDGVGDIPGQMTSPTQGAVRGELKEGIREAVARLPDPDRQVVQLHSFDGLGFREIAEKLGLADKNAARHVFQRALKQMGDLLGPAGFRP